MRNHDEKIKNMQRSVLPSARRKGAREERRAIHKRARSRERDMLTTFDRGSDPDDFDPDFREGQRKSATREMVIERRYADKVGPLTRWAVRTVEADPDLRDAALHDQVAYFEAMLPTDLIGRHAVSHIRWALEWEFHREAIRRYWGPSAGPAREERREQVAADARRILESGRHRELNVALRRAYDAGAPINPRLWRALEPVQPPSRLLAGLHDVDAFADEISKHAWLCGVVAEVVRRR